MELQSWNQQQVLILGDKPLIPTRLRAQGWPLLQASTLFWQMPMPSPGFLQPMLAPMHGQHILHWVRLPAGCRATPGTGGPWQKPGNLHIASDARAAGA
jgi:hypothetical protein